VSPVENAAYEWWKSKRPVKWSEAQHLKIYDVNTTTDAERLLARKVFAMIVGKK
jgi:hypothetical protein